MARTQFDRSDVVEKSMQLFWQQGFSATSMQHVVKATGLKPGSIYLAFGSKEGLYQEALERYGDQSIAFIESRLSHQACVLSGICQLLNTIVSESSTCDFYSCFLVRSRLELPKDSQLHQLAGELLQGIENHYAEYLAREFDEPTSRAYAASLMIHIFGVRVYGFHSESSNKMQQALAQGLPWLPWANHQWQI